MITIYVFIIDTIAWHYEGALRTFELLTFTRCLNRKLDLIIDLIMRNVFHAFTTD